MESTGERYLLVPLSQWRERHTRKLNLQYEADRLPAIPTLLSLTRRSYLKMQRIGECEEVLNRRKLRSPWLWRQVHRDVAVLSDSFAVRRKRRRSSGCGGKGGLGGLTVMSCGLAIPLLMDKADFTIIVQRSLMDRYGQSAGHHLLEIQGRQRRVQLTENGKVVEHRLDHSIDQLVWLITR